MAASAHIPTSIKRPANFLISRESPNRSITLGKVLIKIIGATFSLLVD
jgi:hypothetical protein